MENNISAASLVLEINRVERQKHSAKNKMATILAEYRLLEKLIGLNPLSGSGIRFLQFIHLVIIISFLSSELTFFVVNIHYGIERAGSVLPPIGGILPESLIHIYFLLNHERYWSIMNAMQDIVRESTRNP